MIIKLECCEILESKFCVMNMKTPLCNWKLSTFMGKSMSRDLTHVSLRFCFVLTKETSLNLNWVKLGEVLEWKNILEVWNLVQVWLFIEVFYIIGQNMMTTFDNILRLQNANCSGTFVFWISEQFAFRRHKMLSKHFNKETLVCFEILQ